MKNELGRKITSLTLMTIMFAGGMTIAAPSFMPEAAADEKLMYVSAENSLFGNTFAGGQIVEIIVRDPARDETDEEQSEPEVEVNDETLRMVQGDDGYWYAYIASTAAAAVADANANIDLGTALTIGTGPDLCQSAGTCRTGLNVDLQVSSTATVYESATGGMDNTQTIYGKVSAPTLSDRAEQANGAQGQAGQLNVDASLWPFIQTWEFADDDEVTIVMEKPGDDEVVVLNFEAGGDGMEDYAYIELDRNDAPAGAEVFMTIYDQQLNLDPTVEDAVWFLTNGTYGVSFNTTATFAAYSSAEFGDNGALKIDYNPNSASTIPLVSADNADCNWQDAVSTEAVQTSGSGLSGYHCFTETSSNSGIFTNGDDADAATLEIASGALRGTTGTIDYNDSAQSIVVTTYGATINMHEEEAGDEWNSGEPITVTLVDGDRNLNTGSDEDLTVATSDNVPTIQIGSPIGITDGSDLGNVTVTLDDVTGIATFTVQVGSPAPALSTDRTGGAPWTLDLGPTFGTINDMNTTSTAERYVSYDMTDLCVADTVDIAGLSNQAVKAVVSYGTADLTSGQENFVCDVVSTNTNADAEGDTFTGVIHFMSFGPSDNHGAYYVEVEETDDNTGVFVGDVEFIMVNQNNIDTAFYTGDAISDSVTMVMTADFTGTDAPRIKYNDTDADGVFTGVADQVDAPTHSGTVDFDSDSYKKADTVTITLTDQDLNTDSELIDVYITQNADDRVGDGDTEGKHILDVYFGDYEYDDDCEGSGATQIASTGLESTGFQLVETGTATGIFTGTFQIPEEVCKDTVSQSSTGLDMFVNYWDYRDAGGNTIEVGDASTVSSNTGTVALDRSVYPVPFTWGQFTDHADTAISGNDGNVTITVAVTDPDYDVSPVGEDTIAAGQVVIKAVRGSTTATIEDSFALTETEASSGVFEYEFTINGTSVGALGNTALRQGDVITAEYTDPTDASGNSYLNVDSSTLDLRTGSLLSDKSVYVIGSDAIITIVDADLNLDYDTVESWTLNLVEWDSDAGEVNLGDTNTAFDAEPAAFRETGVNTGIFQTVIEIPATIGSSATVVDQGEKIDLEYVDYGPSGENYYNDDTEDVELTIYTSNFGATVELDSKVYTWTDRVFVTIVAPDHNTDTALVDEIGGSDKTLTAQTRESKLTAYKLVETGVDTGIFWGEITLQGFSHDADGDGTNDTPIGTASAASAGPTDGILKSSESDGVTVSFEYTEDSTVVSSSLIRWNIGEVSFDEDSFLSSGSAVVSVVDPDMNRNPDSTENFKVDVYSDSDSGGIELTVTETNESTGVFEATVYFTTDDASSGHTLRVSEGDSITAEYSDHTLPEPYSTSDDIDVTATAVIGTSTPPLERAPVANARVVDAFGNSLAEVSVDQQVQIEADLVNGAGGDQSFAYLVQVQDSDGVTVSLAWITGQLSDGQSFSPALSWIPSASGSYEATVFVWESVDNPTALSDTASVSITVV